MVILCSGIGDGSKIPHAKVAYEISVADAMLVSKNGEISNLVKVEPKKPVKEKRNKVTVKTRHNPNGFNLD